VTGTVSERRQLSLALLLRQCENKIKQRLQGPLADAGLVFEHWRVMSVLAQDPGLTMSELSVAAVVSQASLTRHVDRLVEIGIVVRRVDPSDRRRAVVALSPRGSRMATMFRAHEVAVEAELVERFGEHGFAELADRLQQLSDALD